MAYRLSRLSLSRNSVASPPIAVCESRWPRVIAPKLSSLRAIVAINLRSPFTSVATGRNSGADAWCVLWVRPRPWIAWSARQPGSSR